MNTKFWTICFTVFVAVLASSFAVEEPIATVKEVVPGKLDLGQAEAVALRYAPQIAEAYFKAEASREAVREARAGLFPQITGIVSAVATGAKIANAFGANYNTSEVQRIGASGGLNAPGIYNRESNGISITQLITDFGRTPNLISAARFESLSQAEKSRLARAQVLLLVDEAYFKTLGAQALLRVANDTVAARQLTYDQVNALTQSQLKSDLDLTFAKVDLENAKLLVIQSQNAVDESMADLSAALGLHEKHAFTLSDQEQQSLPRENIQALIERALRYRPEIVALREEWQGEVKYADAERAARYPTISAQGVVGTTPVGDAAVEGDYSAVGINVEVPIFTGGLLTARYHEASDRASAAKKAMDEAEDEIVRDVRNAWLDANTALQKIQVTQELVASANKALELASSKYKLGAVSIIELSQAQLNHTQAAIGYASARYEYEIDFAKLEYQIGALKFLTPNTAAH